MENLSSLEMHFLMKLLYSNHMKTLIILIIIFGILILSPEGSTELTAVLLFILCSSIYYLRTFNKY